MSRDDDQTCPACGGSGEDEQASGDWTRPCPLCKGRGWL